MERRVTEDYYMTREARALGNYNKVYDRSRCLTSRDS